MKCPICKKDTKVIDSRTLEQGTIIRRRRSCRWCKFRFNTEEKIETPKFMVKKKEGQIEPYDRNKLITGLELAFEKRPIKNSDIIKIVSIVEQSLQDSSQVYIKSKDIGSLVMDQLKNIDEVAYMRFASVYKSFDSAQKFKDELENLSVR